MPSCKHNISLCMHMSYINMHFQYANMHAQYPNMHTQYAMHIQYILVQAQHTNMHAQNANMTYAHTTCQHAYTIYQHAICTCNMPLCSSAWHMQYACTKCVRTTATWHSPKIKVHGYKPQGVFPSHASQFMDINHKGFSIHHATEKDFEVVEKPSPLGNKCKGQMGEPLPTCQGAGVRCIRYQGCTHRSQTTDWE